MQLSKALKTTENLRVGENEMLSRFVVSPLALTVAGAAFAQNAHYLKLDASVDQNTGCYEVTLKEAGLGNSGLSSVEYALSADATFTTVCITKNGNHVQGVPKSGSGAATSLTPLTIRNGSTSGTVSLCPAAFTLPDPGCTGNQRLEIIAASYTNVTLNDQLPADMTAGVQNLPSLSVSDLSIIVQ
jgi:hypothetical protein